MTTFQHVGVGYDGRQDVRLSMRGYRTDVRVTTRRFDEDMTHRSDLDATAVAMMTA